MPAGSVSGIVRNRTFHRELFFISCLLFNLCDKYITDLEGILIRHLK